MKPSPFSTGHAVLLALLVSSLLILRQYTDYLINDYGYQFSWFVVSTRILITYLLWGVSFHFLLRIAQKLLARKIGVWTALKHVGISLLIAICHRVLTVLLFDIAYYFRSGFLPDWFALGNQVALSAGLFSSVLEYWLIMCLLLAITYYSRYLKQQKELNEARLSALQHQLQPHFLFNTLNSISSLIDIDSKKAQKMLAQLGQLLRQILEKDQRQMISFEHELNYIKAYLEIERIRFQDRLSLTFDIDDQALATPVPPLLLQPLVENAIKHGISRNVNGGSIALNAKVFDKALHIRITNDCPAQNGSVNGSGFGIGIRNVAARLEELYGDQQAFNAEKTTETYTATLKIPCNT
ncbi:MAG: histidine kinase [Cytophagales bacterium]|nr:histidine kinase [Cytophagales bacterium]